MSGEPDRLSRGPGLARVTIDPRLGWLEDAVSRRQVLRAAFTGGLALAAGGLLEACGGGGGGNTTTQSAPTIQKLRAGRRAAGFGACASCSSPRGV
jgi:hypothetical protein